MFQRTFHVSYLATPCFIPCNITSDRLEHVYLSYRRQGTLRWKTARIQIDAGRDTANVDFLGDCNDEDDYGYITLKWLVEGIVSEGTYDIKVGTETDKLRCY